METSVAKTILEQLGGNRFIVMTGVKNLVDTGNGLRMQLPRNGSKANRLEIILEPTDTYTMRFYKYIAPKINYNKGTYEDEKVTEVAKYEDVYYDSLQAIFTKVTGMYTHL